MCLDQSFEKAKIPRDFQNPPGALEIEAYSPCLGGLPGQPQYLNFVAADEADENTQIDLLGGALCSSYHRQFNAMFPYPLYNGQCYRSDSASRIRFGPVKVGSRQDKE